MEIDGTKMDHTFTKCHFDSSLITWTISDPYMKQFCGHKHCILRESAIDCVCVGNKINGFMLLIFSRNIFRIYLPYPFCPVFKV